VNNTSRHACCILSACVIVLLNSQGDFLYKMVINISHHLAGSFYDYEYGNWVQRSIIIAYDNLALPAFLFHSFSMVQFEGLHGHACLLLYSMNGPVKVREKGH